MGKWTNTHTLSAFILSFLSPPLSHYSPPPCPYEPSWATAPGGNTCSPASVLEQLGGDEVSPTSECSPREAHLGSVPWGTWEWKGHPGPKPSTPLTSSMKPPSPSLLLAWGERDVCVPASPGPATSEAEAQTPNLGPESPRDRTTQVPTFHLHPGWLALKAGPQPGAQCLPGKAWFRAVRTAVFQKPGPAGSALTANLGNSGAQALWPSVEGRAQGSLSSILEAGEGGPWEPGGPAAGQAAPELSMSTQVCACMRGHMHVRAWAHVCTCVDTHGYMTV